MYNPNIHHRRSIRLPGYDYTNPGAYFITICVQDRACLLGEVTNKVMWLSAFGKMAKNQWERLSEFFKHIAAIIQNYCSVTSTKINVIRQTPGVNFWQYNYHDHIIRNEKAFQRIRKYILDNPANWEDDIYF